MSSRHEVAQAIQNAVGPIYVTAHHSPDGDAIGSILALTGALKSMGKEVYPVMEDDLPENLSFLPGADQIQKPKAFSTPTTGLLVSVDVSGRTRMNVPAEWNLPLVIIDHHGTGKQADGLIWCVPTATATGQLIEELLREEWQVKLTPEIATCLYLAIATDSGFFKYSNTTSEVLRTVASLVEAGAEPNFVSENFEIRSFKSLQRLSESLGTLEVLWAGWLAEMTIIVTAEDESGFSDGFVDFPRSIPTTEIAVFYKVVNSGTIRVSLRSKGFNVAQVAEALGGGGHFRAAGLTFTGSLDQAKETVRKTIASFRGHE